MVFLYAILASSWYQVAKTLGEALKPMFQEASSSLSKSVLGLLHVALQFQRRSCCRCRRDLGRSAEIQESDGAIPLEYINEMTYAATGAALDIFRRKLSILKGFQTGRAMLSSIR